MAVLTVRPQGLALLDGRSFRCALGRSGVSAMKREGDGATPAGRFPMRHVLYRSDRLARPATALSCRPLRPDDGWCDDPADPARYNRAVRLPYSGSHEAMWRSDGLYDVIGVIGHNDAPAVPGGGSAVFLHVASPDFGPTAGCVAFALPDLLAVLGRLRPGDLVDIRD